MVVCATVKFDERTEAEVENGTFSTLGSSYLNVALATVHHLYTTGNKPEATTIGDPQDGR